MSNNNQDLEVTFNDVVFAVLRRWRTLLTVMLIAAVLLGIFRGVQTLQAVTDPSPKEQQAYEQKLQQYEQDREAQKKVIAQLQSSADYQSSYLEQSYYMNMDSSRIWTARASYYIDSAAVADPAAADPIYALLAAYQVELLSSDTMQALGKALDLEPEYALELLRVHTGASASPVSRVISVAVCHNDKEVAMQGLEALQDQLKKITAGLNRQIGSHSTALLSSSLVLGSDLDVYEDQADGREMLAEMQKNVDDAWVAYNEIEKPAQKERAAMSDVFTDGAGFALLGAVIGLFAAAAVVGVGYLLSDRVCSGMDTVRRTGIRLLGSIEKTDRRVCRLDTAIFHHQGRQPMTQDEAYALTGADLTNYSGRCGKILLSGDVPFSVLKEMADRLTQEVIGLQLQTFGDIVRDARSAQALAECDAVVLVVQAGQSRYSAVRRQMAKAESLDKPVLGCVALEK